MEKNLNKASSRKLINDLYQTVYRPKLPNGEACDITVDGSLGLLATGYTGLIAWRKKRGMQK
jgi:hypothetical protein